MVISALTLLVLTVVTGAHAQADDPTIMSTRVFGKVTEISARAEQMTVKTDAGTGVAVSLDEKTTYERMPPGETDRTKAVKIALTDISIGNSLYIPGSVAANCKSISA